MLSCGYRYSAHPGQNGPHSKWLVRLTFHELLSVIVLTCCAISAVAGHSLGSALATLCAFDIAAAVKQAGATAEGGKPVDVSCYTFGAPRTGNRAFRNEFNSLVPNCWGIINDQVKNSIPWSATAGASSMVRSRVQFLGPYMSGVINDHLKGSIPWFSTVGAS